MDISISYYKNSSVVTTELEDGAVLLNLLTKYYYNLNQTGLEIWRALDETYDPDKIVAKLTDTYYVDEKVALENTLSILRGLEEEGLILASK